MSDPQPIPEETPGQHCARWLKAAKQKAQETNTVLSWTEVAKIIDHTIKGLACFSHSKAQKSEFGDRKVIPPQPEDVTAYSASIGLKLDGAEFCDFYASKGWVVGKAKMKDWQAAVRTWGRDGRRKPTETKTKDYSRL